MSRAHITIFYPGYGYFPLYYNITDPPPPQTGYEDLLKMMEKQEVVFALPPLSTREERLKVIRTVNPLVVPKGKMPNSIRLVNEERRNLHLPPLYGAK